MIYKKSRWSLVHESQPVPFGRHILVNFSIALLMLSVLAVIGLFGQDHMLIVEYPGSFQPEFLRDSLLHRLSFGCKYTCRRLNASLDYVVLHDSAYTEQSDCIFIADDPFSIEAYYLTLLGQIVKLCHVVVLACTLGFSVLCLVLALDLSITLHGVPRMQLLGILCLGTALCLFFSIGIASNFILWCSYSKEIYEAAQFYPQISFFATVALAFGLAVLAYFSFRASETVDFAIQQPCFVSTQGDEAIQRRVQKMKELRYTLNRPVIYQPKEPFFPKGKSFIVKG